MLDNMEANNPAITMFRFDVAGLFNQALGDPASFGLTNVTDAAGITLFLVPRTAAGVSVRESRTLDNLRAADIEVTTVPYKGTGDMALAVVGNQIDGDQVYVDYLRVTFDDKYIEESDLDRSTAICLFQRIFGEYQDPAEGFHLDTVGTRPIVSSVTRRRKCRARSESPSAVFTPSRIIGSIQSSR